MRGRREGGVACGERFTLLVAAEVKGGEFDVANGKFFRG